MQLLLFLFPLQHMKRPALQNKHYFTFTLQVGVLRMAFRDFPETGPSGRENLQLFLFSVLFPLQHMKRPAIQNKQVGVLQMGFWNRKVLRTFEKAGPWRFER